MKQFFLYISLLMIIISVPGTTVSAERINTIGVSAGIIASADDRPYIDGFSPSAASDEYFFVGSFYPRITLDSRGPGSLFRLSYGFGMNRVDSDQDLNSESHSVGLEWDTTLGQRGTFRLSNDFRQSPDFDSFTLFRGLVETPDGYFFDFDTVAQRRKSYWNSTTANLGIAIGEKANLDFFGGFSFRNYENLPGFQKEDQVRYNAGTKFSRDISGRTSWNIGYDARYWEYYGGASSAYSHSAGLGLDHRFSPTVALNLSAGPSYVVSTGSQDQFADATGYNVSASLNKRVEKHLFSLSFSERSAATYGSGGLAKTWDAGLTYSRDFERVLVNASLRYFDTEALSDTGYSPEGVYSMLSFGFKLTRSLMFEVGGSYRKQNNNDSGIESVYGDYDRKRVYVSIRFNFPELWRTGG
jgi:hypothetical protein